MGGLEEVPALCGLEEAADVADCGDEVVFRVFRNADAMVAALEKGGDGLYRSRDDGATWEAPSPIFGSARASASMIPRVSSVRDRARRARAAAERA